jgi:hypothetical protein
MPAGRVLSMAEAGALERAFRDVCEGGAMAGVDAEPLLLDGMRDARGKLPTDVFRRLRKGEARRPGRPPGAGNKRNQKLAQLICQQHGDPVMYMASIYSMPTDQLVELLRLADDSAEMEERLYRLAEKIEGDVSGLLGKANLNAGQLKALDGLIDRLGDIAKVLRVKPGDLAVKALALQKQAAQAVAEYVHGKQPVSVEVKGRVDAVIFAPGLGGAQPIGDPRMVEAEIRKRGLDAIDFEGMKLLPGVEVDSAEDDESEEGADNG